MPYKAWWYSDAVNITNRWAIEPDPSRTDCIQKNGRSPQTRDKPKVAMGAARLKQGGDLAAQSKPCVVLPFPKT
jgi:hypothetical protein